MYHLNDIVFLRSFIWRLGRRLYCWARRDVPNDPSTNGEYWLIDKMLNGSSIQSVVLMDIGANKGDWTAQASASLARSGKSGRLYAFEPTQSTYSYLSKRLEGDGYVQLEKFALSDSAGDADFYVVGDLAGTNSLHDVQGATAENVRTQTVDNFLAAEKVSSVLFVKCDTEGHDMSVLRGAEKSLASGFIEVWQFEYNHRWMANHSLLRDVFEFIKDKPYRLGKLYGNGIEIFQEWHPELDRFFEANYVLIRRGSYIETSCVFTCFDEKNVIVPVR
jgi:FkbM family methyltransferase